MSVCIIPEENYLDIICYLQQGIHLVVHFKQDLRNLQHVSQVQKKIIWEKYEGIQRSDFYFSHCCPIFSFTVITKQIL